MIISRSPKTDLASICGLNTIILPSVDIWIFLGSFTRRQRSHKRNLDIVQWTVSVSRLRMMICYLVFLSIFIKYVKDKLSIWSFQVFCSWKRTQIARLKRRHRWKSSSAWTIDHLSSSCVATKNPGENMPLMYRKAKWTSAKIWNIMRRKYAAPCKVNHCKYGESWLFSCSQLIPGERLLSLSQNNSFWPNGQAQFFPKSRIWKQFDWIHCLLYLLLRY